MPNALDIFRALADSTRLRIVALVRSPILTKLAEVEVVVILVLIVIPAKAGIAGGKRTL
jgi:hypothetical protein